MRPFHLALVAVLVVTSCGTIRESRLNPFNWFGQSRSERVVTVARAVESRPLIPDVTSLKVDRLPGGAIVRAEGLASTQGYYDGELVARNGGKPDRGTLTFDFRIVPPPKRHAVGAPQTRLVLVGASLSDQDLAGVRRVVVVGQNNQRSASR